MRVQFSRKLSDNPLNSHIEVDNRHDKRDGKRRVTYSSYLRLFHLSSIIFYAISSMVVCS